MLRIEKNRNLKMSELNKKDKGARILSKAQIKGGDTNKKVVSGAVRHSLEKQIKAKIEKLDKEEVELEKEVCKNDIKLKPDDHSTCITEILIKRITEADLLKEDDHKPNRGQKK
nr:unnamed protein product [Callosobruchus analis]